MKPAPLLLALTTLVVASAVTLNSTHVTRTPAAPQPDPAKHQGEQVTISAKSDQPADPTLDGQSGILQALDQSVLAVMHNKEMSNEQKFAFFWDGYQENKSSITLATYYIDCLS